MRLRTPDCRTPSALAAALKLRYSATTSAWPTETRSIPRDNSRLAKQRFSSSANVMRRSEEHTSELQSLMRISYAVFCLKNNTSHKIHTIPHAFNHYHSLYTSLYTID